MTCPNPISCRCSVVTRMSASHGAVVRDVTCSYGTRDCLGDLDGGHADVCDAWQHRRDDSWRCPVCHETRQWCPEPDWTAPHVCDEWRLPDGDCEACWLASK